MAIKRRPASPYSVQPVCGDPERHRPWAGGAGDQLPRSFGYRVYGADRGATKPRRVGAPLVGAAFTHICGWTRGPNSKFSPLPGEGDRRRRSGEGCGSKSLEIEPMRSVIRTVA